MVKTWSVSYPGVSGKQRRRVYLYLPRMYYRDRDRRFPVLYMFDGQNVFFDEDASFGKSWGLGDYLDKHRVPIIVAAIECNPGENDERMLEYSPYEYDEPELGHLYGCGDDTFEWIITRFKPFIDEHFRTIGDREHTFIGGSSMGGLMALYGLLNYNEIFSRAAALSPSIWVAPEQLMELSSEAPLDENTVLYMDYGTQEEGTESNMFDLFAAMGAHLLNCGVDITLRVVPNGDHSEASWERQLPFMMHTLMYDVDV
ncbi:MAG: alpha/beta hydrolase-fold protein [Phascolarctobacterium sp.]|nr:alpha/beta hydrolase-fold protein [Phascolarctobacterium sp.]